MMAGLGPLLRKELLEQWRTLRLPVIAMIFLLVGLSSPLLARFTPEILKAVGGEQFTISIPTPTAADSIDQLAKNLGQFGGLIAVLLAMGAVATEKERGTAALLLTKPVSRAAFLVAKLVAIGLTLAVSVAVATAGASITFVGSTLTRSALAAAGLGIVAFIVVGILGVVPNVGRFLPTGLGGPGRALALGVPGPDPVVPTLATLALIGVAIFSAWIAFRRQEL